MVKISVTFLIPLIVNNPSWVQNDPHLIPKGIFKKDIEFHQFVKFSAVLRIYYIYCTQQDSQTWLNISDFLVLYLEKVSCENSWDPTCVFVTLKELGIHIKPLWLSYDKLFKTKVWKMYFLPHVSII